MSRKKTHFGPDKFTSQIIKGLLALWLFSLWTAISYLGLALLVQVANKN